MKKLMCVAAFVVSLAASGVVSAADPSGWFRFSPIREKFSIFFPSATPVSSPPTDKIPMTLHMDMDGTTVYQLGVLELPKAMQKLAERDPEGALDGLAFGIIKGAGECKILSQEKVTVAGFHGREIKGSILDGASTFRCQIVLTKDRVYLMMVVASADEDVSAKTKFFFGSFKLKEALVEADAKQV